MALQRDTLYPGRYTTGDATHPQGAFKNRTTPDAQDGSYLEAQWLNDWDGFFASLLSKAGVTPDGNVDAVGASQYFDGLSSIVSNITHRGQFHKLTATAGGSNYTASATAETLVVADSSYNCIGLRNVSVSVNGSTSGAGGLDTGTIAAANWYYLHVIYNPTTQVVTGLLSLSATAPTLPSGYTHFAAVQPLYIVASTTAFLPMSSYDGETRFTNRITVLNAGTATSVTAVSLATAVPPSAIPKIIPSTSTNTSTSARIVVSEDSAGLLVIAVGMSNGVTQSTPPAYASLPTQTIYYSMYSASYSGSIYVIGFKWTP